MSTVKTVAGRFVTGEIPTRYRENRPAQLSIEKFLDALDTLFEFPEVEAVRWSQYTPSFNDGDPCVFTTDQFYVKLVDVEDGGEHGDGYFTEYCVDRHFTTLTGTVYEWRDRQHHPIAAALDEVFDYKAVRAYYDALEDAFGDPAEVTATRQGFHVEHYDCEY